MYFVHNKCFVKEL